MGPIVPSADNALPDGSDGLLIESDTAQKNDSGLHQKPISSKSLKMGTKTKRGRKPKGSSPFTKNFKTHRNICV
jgi:hypothetical protein